MFTIRLCMAYQAPHFKGEQSLDSFWEGWGRVETRKGDSFSFKVPLRYLLTPQDMNKNLNLLATSILGAIKWQPRGCMFTHLF